VEAAINIWIFVCQWRMEYHSEVRRVFEFVFDDTDDPVVSARITAAGVTVFVMAEVEDVGRSLRLIGLHLHSLDGCNAVGVGGLRRLADAVMEVMDYDELIVEGAVRTTGANPGHRPNSLRFTRRSGVAPR
jgi:hypothetical protein